MRKIKQKKNKYLWENYLINNMTRTFNMSLFMPLRSIHPPEKRLPKRAIEKRPGTRVLSLARPEDDVLNYEF